MPGSFLLNLASASFVWWLAVYLLSRNTGSKLAWISAGFLASLSVYTLAMDVSRNLVTYSYYQEMWRYADWSYLLPIALIFHFSAAVSGRDKDRDSKIFIATAYFLVVILQVLISTTNLIFQNSSSDLIPGAGYSSTRGPLFWLIGLFTVLASLGPLRNYLVSFAKNKLNRREKIKYSLAILSTALYLITTPIMLYLYYAPLESLSIQLTPVLLGLPFVPIVIAIFFYGLISDVDYLFNWREFSYLSITMFILAGINASLFTLFIAPDIGEAAFILAAIFSFVTIFTHGFYDWLTTFVRDLVYNTGKGFSLITDADVTDLVRNFHQPERLETNSIMKFKVLSKRAREGKLLDAAQDLTREAIEYFKQPDFPRRTKQNLKYQLLRMLTLDNAEEGQILWELGFEGYPAKIMSGENGTRRPLFKVEAMSDYTAISRNAYFALKKEAMHDLAWRLSYMEKVAQKQR